MATIVTQARRLGETIDALLEQGKKIDSIVPDDTWQTYTITTLDPEQARP